MVRLVPIGPLPGGAAPRLAAALSRRVAVPVSLAGSLGEIAPPRLSGRDQVDADGLLRGLEDRVAAVDAVVVGVTGLDIAIPIFTFVFALARQSGHAAVVSTARLAPEFYGLPPDTVLTTRRTVFEILHQLGHVAGLEHCRDPGCLMRFAGSVEQVDVRGSVFCERCAQRSPGWLRGRFPAREA